MARLKCYLIGGATLLCALGTGYVMQYGLTLPGGGRDSAQAADLTLEISSVTPASSGVLLPQLPKDAQVEPTLPDDPVFLKAAAETQSLEADLPENPAATGFDCDVTMQAEPGAGALVHLNLTAPCRASERVTIHHQGLMFTEVMQPDGTLFITIPALAEQASFIASFASGDGAMANTEVTSLPFYDRVAVQWKGEAGLQLHAREYSAAYFSDGHVWAAAAGTLTEAATGQGGFLTRLGQMDTPEALVAEIYSFPTGTAKRGGEVLLTVEAEVTGKNCGTQVEAQTLEIRDGSALRVRDLSVEIPHCDSVGDFLVLKNVVEDMTIAAR
ncbi:translocase [Antarctobacter jejuensis]|uniref:translocase n=1 Tax=Antarctobacter jejuensis TaxID=1439938 RepID=UPI003FD69FB7